MWREYCQTASPPGIPLMLAQRSEQLLLVGAASHSQSFIGVHYWQASQKKTSNKQPPIKQTNKKTQKQMLKMERCLARCYRALCNDDNVALWLHNLIYTNIKRGTVCLFSPLEFLLLFVSCSPYSLLSLIRVTGKSTAQARALPVRTVALSR